MDKINKIKVIICVSLLFLIGMIGLSGCENSYIANDALWNVESSRNDSNDTHISHSENEQISFNLEDIPKFSNQAYVTINQNIPFFAEEDDTAESFENYSELDSLGRCGTAFACIGKDIMPTEERGTIGQVKPSGWKTVKYECIDGKYLYNRCHLIGYQLAGENANEKNLITGTRYMNTKGMLPFEDMVANYVKKTNNHVLYRVTPIFEGENLVAKGVLMEAKSVEDSGKAICFNVFCYNSQPQIQIDYATGESSYAENAVEENGEDDRIVNSKLFEKNIVISVDL